MLHIEKPELLNIIEGPSAIHGSFTCRPSHALVFKLSGESIYTFSDRTLRLRGGELLFVPQGAAYSFGKTSPGESRYLLVNFRGQVEAAAQNVVRFIQAGRKRNFYPIKTNIITPTMACEVFARAQEILDEQGDDGYIEVVDPYTFFAMLERELGK